MDLKLIRKNQEVCPESFEKLYGFLVSKKFRARYSADETEAIVNNYISDPTNEKYASEMKAMQEYRKQCKIETKLELGIDI